MKRNIEGFIEEGKYLMRKCQGWKDIRPVEVMQIVETGKKEDGSTDAMEIALNAFYFGVAVAKKTADREAATAAARSRKEDPELSVRHKDRTKITLKAARIAAGYTQEELARLIGVTARSVSRYERGAASPRAYYLHQFCVVTGFSVDDIEL